MVDQEHDYCANDGNQQAVEIQSSHTAGAKQGKQKAAHDRPTEGLPLLEGRPRLPSGLRADAATLFTRVLSDRDGQLTAGTGASRAASDHPFPGPGVAAGGSTGLAASARRSLRWVQGRRRKERAQEAGI